MSLQPEVLIFEEPSPLLPRPTSLPPPQTSRGLNKRCFSVFWGTIIVRSCAQPCSFHPQRYKHHWEPPVRSCKLHAEVSSRAGLAWGSATFDFPGRLQHMRAFFRLSWYRSTLHQASGPWQNSHWYPSYMIPTHPVVS